MCVCVSVCAVLQKKNEMHEIIIIIIKEKYVGSFFFGCCCFCCCANDVREGGWLLRVFLSLLLLWHLMHCKRISYIRWKIKIEVEIVLFFLFAVGLYDRKLYIL